MRHEHALVGCAPIPLAHYLKALGVLRLVAEQKDADAMGHWRGERFVLGTNLSSEQLVRFFLDEYRPSPLVAPWNGGSGFYPNDNKTGITAIQTATATRFTLFRKVVERAAALVGDRVESPSADEKALFLVQLRSSLPDEALAWFDTAVVLSGEQPGYPPLLGSGGNDGRLDFTNNFMQRLVEIIDPVKGQPAPNAARWLDGALFGKPIDGLVARAIGQFAPGQAGGPNATAGFEAKPSINPWDFVLMLEGSLVFAGAATRRLGHSASGGFSCPFTVRTTGSGSGSGSLADEKPSRAEIWMPLWHSPIRWMEMKLLFAEGRVTVGRRQAHDGLDFARAVGSYGTDRGIAAFQRYGFLMRSGKAYLATPLARVQVQRNPRVDLLSQLDQHNWLERLRRFARSDTAPGRLRQLVRQLEDTIFALTRFGGRTELQRILNLLGRLQHTCATSGKCRDAVPPMPLLGPEWVTEADDRSHEFRLACALAGLHGMRPFIFPLKTVNGRFEWDAGSRDAVWKDGDLVRNLVKVLDRRLLKAAETKEGVPSAADAPLSGFLPVGFQSPAAFLDGETDDLRIADLLSGLVNVRSFPSLPPPEEPWSGQPPADVVILKPFFTPDSLLRRLKLLEQDARLPLPREFVVLLSSGQSAQVQKVLNMAWQRLRTAGFPLPTHPRGSPAPPTRDGARLAAALTVPLKISDLDRMFQRTQLSSATPTP